ncbi:transcriptional repressor [bacterium]|nr:MAG: transcriptional repressor [bacterium]
MRRKKIPTKELKKYLHDADIQPSYHRMKILEYLITHRDHPTVDMIYKYLRPKIPTLSKTTVYNSLNLFVEKSIAIGLNIEDNEVRYDLAVKPHMHLKCIKCGKIYDIDVQPPLFENQIIDGHKIIQGCVYLKGICRECLKNKR